MSGDGVPRYNEQLSMAEYRIAACDEVDLEAIVWQEREPECDTARRYHEADKAALREIERLKLSGAYEAERARLANYLEPPSPMIQRLMQRIEAGDFEPLNNFMDGLKSPDPDQRARFQRLYEGAELGDKTPRELWHILECLESAKKEKEGRPKAIPPWRNVLHQMDAMRLVVANGSTIPEAARQVAQDEREQGVENRAKYFERLYRQRADLRK